jgi:hypothetical protein
MFKFLFYFSTIFFLISELKWIISPFKKTQQLKKDRELTFQYKDKEWDL